MAEWKYIAYQIGDQTVPIIFPNMLNHVDVARCLNRLASDNGRRSGPVVSAGFVAALSCVSTFGESESLGGLKSKDDDARIINCMPYDNGRDTGMPNLEPMLLLKTIELLMERVKDGGL